MSERNSLRRGSKAEPLRRTRTGVTLAPLAHPTGERIHGTTILCVRRDNKVVVAGDGQVTMGEGVVKHNAKKTRRLFNDKIIAGFAGSTGDALSLFTRFENKLQEFHGNLARAAVELAKEWRTDRALRHLEALAHRRRHESHISSFGQWRRDRARRRNLRHRLRRPVRSRRSPRFAEALKAQRQRNRAGSDAHRQRNLHFYQREFFD